MVSSINLPYVANPKAAGKILNEVDSTQDKPSSNFASFLKADIKDKYQSWKQVEQSVYNVAIGTEDSETVIPVVAKTLREVQTVSSLVKETTSALVKVLDQQA